AVHDRQGPRILQTHDRGGTRTHRPDHRGPDAAARRPGDPQDREDQGMIFDPLLITSILVFACVATAAYAIATRVASDQGPVEARLRQLRSAYSGEVHVRFGERPALW